MLDAPNIAMVKVFLFRFFVLYDMINDHYFCSFSPIQHTSPLIELIFDRYFLEIAIIYHHTIFMSDPCTGTKYPKRAKRTSNSSNKSPHITTSFCCHQPKLESPPLQPAPTPPSHALILISIFFHSITSLSPQNTVAGAMANSFPPVKLDLSTHPSLAKDTDGNLLD